mmetsp:Transcript_43883/g.123976  ORF Transcript_43883/g.123976 Transcript_43883/m.123976 type:complete len:200 (+) Transcript_43883:428-1027(+)
MIGTVSRAGNALGRYKAELCCTQPSSALVMIIVRPKDLARRSNLATRSDSDRSCRASGPETFSSLHLLRYVVHSRVSSQSRKITVCRSAELSIWLDLGSAFGTAFSSCQTNSIRPMGGTTTSESEPLSLPSVSLRVSLSSVSYMSIALTWAAQSPRNGPDIVRFRPMQAEIDMAIARRGCAADAQCVRDRAKTTLLRMG